jgi:acyl carrier protein
MTSDVRAQVYELVSDVFGVALDEIDPARSWEELGADSFDLVEFIVAVDERFQLDLDPAELNGVRTIEGVIGFVERRAARTRAAALS